jgi:hypothetical protein
VVSLDTKANTLFLTIAVEAIDPWAAANLAGTIYAESLNAAELPVAPVVDVQVTVVGDERPKKGRARALVKA